MSVGLVSADRQVVSVILAGGHDRLALSEEAVRGIDKVLSSTTSFKLGLHMGNVVYVLGLMAPNMMSDQAYLWMYVVDHAPQGSVVVLMRRSRETIQGLLTIYPTILGHANELSARWLRWLGAEFGEPLADGLIPFTFRRHNG